MVCNDCPRNCNVDLNCGVGFCGKNGNNLRIAKVMRHMWEEPIISGEHGSGAVFFSNCSLKCCFCQNYKISHCGVGKDFTVDNFVEILKKIDLTDVENINLVSPSHYSSLILKALDVYKPVKPIVWNCGGYEKDIEKLKGKVKIFLFDIKYFSDELSLKYSKCSNYFDVCLNAIKSARKIIPKDIVKNNVMQEGIIIRHLVLPNCYLDSIKIFEKLKQELGCDFYVSLMSQYVPCYKAKDDDKISRVLKPIEYKKVLNKIEELGFNKGFIQDFSSAKTEFTPDFDLDKFWAL